MSKKRVLILVPARFASTRFPGKPLAMIKNKSMIARVMENMQKAQSENYEFVSCAVTDDQRIEDHLKEQKIKVVRVDDDVNSGTLRIELAHSRYFKNENFDLIINVQGDEPLLQYEEIVGLAKFHLESKFDITTLVKKNMGFTNEFFDTNKVKAVVSEKTRQALYFSRSSIPYKRDSSQDPVNDYWLLHIGVYSYRPEALNLFANATVSRLEELEKLEQLRAMELGLTIGALETKSLIMGVDNPEDIKKVEEVICE